MQAKKNHHYVWAEYLRRWSQDSRNVYFVSPKGKITPHSILDLAKERHFYRCSSLSLSQLRIIRVLSSTADSEIQKLHIKVLSIYFEIQRREQLLSQLGCTGADAANALEVLNANFIEDRHAWHENEAKPILIKLANKDITPLQDDHQLLKFIVFLGHQFTRTSAFKKHCLMVADSRIRQDMQTSWWFLSYMLGINIGAMMYKNRANIKLCLLENETGIKFITSDHPVVNVHEELKEGKASPPEKLDLFYPISPTVAVMANDSDRFASGLNSVDEGYVCDMNEAISRVSEKTIFGLTPDDIRPFKRNIGSRLDKKIQ